MSDVSTTRPSAPSAFERSVTAAWRRSFRRFLPRPVAEAIRKPARRTLMAAGLIRKA